MGRSITPTFRAEYKTQDGRWNAIGWNARATQCANVTVHGAPNERNAEVMRSKLNKSFANGGVNAHVSAAVGYILHVSAVRVIRQSTGEVVAMAVAPLFEVA
jgi:hypothetical protein